jgi:hypothetical protein
MNIADLTTEIATTHKIHTMEATDEIWDAIEILWATEDRPEDTLTDWQAASIREYVAEQYATNRTRL